MIHPQKTIYLLQLCDCKFSNLPEVNKPHAIEPINRLRFYLTSPICRLFITYFIPILSTSPTQVKVKRYFLDEGGRNKDESLYVFSSPATYFNLLYPTLPTQVKVKR